MSNMLDSASHNSTLVPLTKLVRTINKLVQTLAQPDLVQVIIRLALAVPFWRSGILKWDGFLQLNDTAIDLFTQEFMLHLPGGPYPFPMPATMAFLSGCGEIMFPILLILGLGTRLAGLGLLFMTLVVELTIPDGWPIHITWAAMELAVMRWGPGRLSLDHLIGRWWATNGNEASAD
jgi:putative oxidoreductase